VCLLVTLLEAKRRTRLAPPDDFCSGLPERSSYPKKAGCIGPEVVPSSAQRYGGQSVGRLRPYCPGRRVNACWTQSPHSGEFCPFVSRLTAACARRQREAYKGVN
jgi:hypothetical protein